MNSERSWQEAFPGGLESPTAFVHALQFMDAKLKDFDLRKDEQDTGTAPIIKTSANAVIVESTPVTLTPADMTIYMGGDGGYDAVVDEDGNVVESSNSLPHPIFRLTGAPSGVTFNNQTFTNAESGNNWKLVPETGAANYYHFENEEGTAVGVRVQYSNEDGAVTSDKFEPAVEKDVFTEYAVSVYTGDTKGIVTAVASDGKNYLINTGEGTLTVRAVEATDPTSDIVANEPTSAVEKNKAVAVAPEGTTYTLNDTGVQLPADAKPSLLFDNIIASDGVDRITPLKIAADEKLGGASEDRQYEIKYLDLVDANNGNAWIKASNGVDIYWGYPEGTDQNTEFTLLHFTDLHRDTSGGGNTGFNPDDIASAAIETITSVENTEKGIKFHVGSGGFSPFVLVWETDNTTGGGGGGTTSYTITASAGNGGVIDPSGSVSVSSGSDKTFTITANEGYEIADVLVDGESVGAVSEYTFENVREKHTIEARFTATGEIPVADPDDTGVSDWLNTDDHISYMNGYPDNTFRPDDNMTRAEAAQMFYNLLLDQDVAVTETFSDVPADAWYADAVNTLATLGMVTGVGDGRYDPDSQITRAEFTAIAMRFADLETGGDNIFSDVAESAWYYDYVIGSIQYGWITGYPDGTFRPDATITRAEVTTIVNRMLGRSADESFIDEHADEIRQFTDLNDSYWGYYNIMEAANAHDFTTENNTETWTALR